MRCNANVEIAVGDTVKIRRGENYTWLEIGAERYGSLPVYLPCGVPIEKLVAIADAINDALDTVSPQKIAEAAE